MQDITPSLFHCYHHSAFKHECSAITGLLQHSHQVIHIIVNKLTVDLDHVSPKRNHRLLSGTIWKEKNTANEGQHSHSMTERRKASLWHVKCAQDSLGGTFVTSILLCSGAHFRPIPKVGCPPGVITAF